jgi:putative Mg2+ transporter-C (MgtC) family protein
MSLSTVQIDWSSLAPLGVAIGLGAVIGLERELSRKAAGLRTNILICLGSALLTQIAMQLDLNPDSSARILQGVITGIGFIGGGVMIRYGASVYGLTTAATIWLVTGIGIAAGARLYSLAAVSTLATLIILVGLNPLDRRIGRHRRKTSPTEID